MTPTKNIKKEEYQNPNNLNSNNLTPKNTLVGTTLEQYKEAILKIV